METFKKVWAFLATYGSPLCDFAQYTVAALAVFTDTFSKSTLTGLLVASAVLLAWRKVFDSLKVTP